MAHQQSLSQAPLILSLTNVAVSKQTALLHATQATQVHVTSSCAAASRIRQHALQMLAQGRLHTDSQAQSSTVNVSAYCDCLLCCLTFWILYTFLRIAIKAPARPKTAMQFQQVCCLVEVECAKLLCLLLSYLLCTTCQSQHVHLHLQVACLTLQATNVLLLASDLHRILHGLICKQLDSQTDRDVLLILMLPSSQQAMLPALLLLAVLHFH